MASARPSRPTPSPGREPSAHRPAPSGSALVSFVTAFPAAEKAEEISDETVPDFSTEADSGTAGVYSTRLTMDMEGNPLVVTDARDNEAMRHVFGMGWRKRYQKSCDAGARWMLARRGAHHFVQKAGEDELLVERVVYGEGHADAEALNLRGKVYRRYDGAGRGDTHDVRGPR